MNQTETLEVDQNVIDILLGKMKVFKMNEHDNVAALNGDRAKKFYSKLTGFTLEEVEEEFEGEINKYTNKMYFLSADFTEEELEQFKPLVKYGSLTLAPVPYDWVIKKNKKIYPYIISTSEQ